ncbi:MAG: hypothetical protein PVF51_14225 [Nitrospirota bacterium]
MSQRQFDLAADHLALHLFTSRTLNTAQQLNATDGNVIVDLASSVAAEYTVDLSIDVSFLSDLTGQMDRLAALKPALLHDFSTAFQALDGSKSAQKAFFRATDTLFDGLERELGLNATELDDEAAVIQQSVRGFFRQVRRFDRLLSKATGDAGLPAGQELHRLATETVHAVKESDTIPAQRLRRVNELLAGIGDDARDGFATKHLGHLFKKLLHATTGGRDGSHGTDAPGENRTRSTLARAISHIAGSPGATTLIRGTIHALDDGIARNEPLTATVAVELATQFAVQVEATLTALGTESPIDTPPGIDAESPANADGSLDDGSFSAPITLAAWGAPAA